MAKYVDFDDAENVVYNEQAISNSIKNILTTVKGSIPGKPQFGTNLGNYLFNNLDHITKSLMIRTIKEALNKFEPRITVTEVNVENVPEYNRVNIEVKYTYVDSGLTIAEVSTIPINV